jgi:hypothetical protein
MRRRTKTLITLALVALLLGACMPAPAPSVPEPETQAAPVPENEAAAAPGTPQGQAAVAPTATTSRPSASSDRALLKDALGTLEPKVWHLRPDPDPAPSHHEEQVRFWSSSARSWG